MDSKETVNKGGRIGDCIPFLAAVLVPAVCYTFFCLTGYIYTYTDNVTVSVITAGMYGENNFCQYLHPFLCLVIRWLNPLLPSADVFTSLVHAALLIGDGLISYASVSLVLRRPLGKFRLEDYILCTLLLLAVIYLTLGMNLFGVNYTVQTAAIIMAGVLVLFHGRNMENGRFWLITGTALISFGYLMRLEAALIFVPYLCLEIMTGILCAEDRKKHIRKDLRTIAPCMLMIALILASKYVFNAREPYASDARYNKYRTVAEDYAMRAYNPYLMKDTGIDESTYAVACDWILADTDRVNADTLEAIANAGSKSDKRPNMAGVKNTLREMRRWAFRTDLHLLLLGVLTIIITTRNLISVRSWWLKLESLSAFCGGFIILFYFTFMGRAPVRVWQCVFLATLSILILVMIKDAQDPKTAERQENKAAVFNTVFQIFLCVVLYFGIGQVMAISSIHEFQTPLTARIGADDSGYEATFEGDALYIWPSWYSAVPDYFAKQNKLPTQRVIEHNIAIGDWTYGQQYFTSFLEGIGAENPAVALLERPDTYLADGQTKELLWYMREHYGEDIQLHCVGRVNGRKVYQLIRSVRPLEGEEDLEELADSWDWNDLEDGE